MTLRKRETFFGIHGAAFYKTFWVIPEVLKMTGLFEKSLKIKWAAIEIHLLLEYATVNFQADTLSNLVTIFNNR